MKGKTKMTTKRLIRIAYFTALTAVGAFIKIPIGTVVFSLQSFFVIMAGLIIGPVDGLIAQAAYMLIGLVGVPIFTQGGGFAYVFQPSFGYIIGFNFGAFVAGIIMLSFRKLNTVKIWIAALIGLIPLYAVGMAYQVMILVCVNGMAVMPAVYTLVTMPFFLLFDIVALLLVAIVYPRLTALISVRRERKAKNTAAVEVSDEESKEEPKEE